MIIGTNHIWTNSFFFCSCICLLNSRFQQQQWNIEKRNDGINNETTGENNEKKNNLRWCKNHVAVHSCAARWRTRRPSSGWTSAWSSTLKTSSRFCSTKRTVGYFCFLFYDSILLFFSVSFSLLFFSFCPFLFCIFSPYLSMGSYVEHDVQSFLFSLWCLACRNVENEMVDLVVGD